MPVTRDVPGMFQGCSLHPSAKRVTIRVTVFFQNSSPDLVLDFRRGPPAQQEVKDGAQRHESQNAQAA